MPLSFRSYESNSLLTLCGHTFTTIINAVTVREEDINLPSPFTQPLSASMVRRKDEQTKEKSHPKGTSKILAKYCRKDMNEREKAEQEAKKAAQAAARVRNSGYTVVCR